MLKRDRFIITILILIICTAVALTVHQPIPLPTKPRKPPEFTIMDIAKGIFVKNNGNVCTILDGVIRCTDMEYYND